MKNYIIAAKLFKRQLKGNLLIILMLIFLCMILAIVINISNSSRANIGVIENCEVNGLYYMNPYLLDYGRTYNENSKELSYDSLKTQLSKINEFIGISRITKSYASLEKSVLTENKIPSEDGSIAKVFLVDNFTADFIRYPLQSGKWFTDVKYQEKNIPCLIGGVYAYKYKPGDKITIYSLAANDKSIISHDLYITGILKKPEQLLKLTLSSTGSFNASRLFENNVNEELIVYAGIDYFDEINAFEYRNSFIYFDKILSKNEIEEISQNIGEISTIKFNELIIEEEKELNNDLGQIVPILFMIFFVSTTGLITMCILNTIKNIEILSIYYLCGSSLRNISRIIGIYASFFIVSSILAFVGVTKIIFVLMRGSFSQYLFYLSGFDAIFILIVCIIISITSMLLPILLIKKNTIIKQLNF